MRLKDTAFQPTCLTPAVFPASCLSQVPWPGARFLARVGDTGTRPLLSSGAESLDSEGSFDIPAAFPTPCP